MKIIIQEAEKRSDKHSITITVDNERVSAKSDNLDYDSVFDMLENMAFVATTVAMKEYEISRYGIRLLQRDIMECAREGMERALEGE